MAREGLLAAIGSLADRLEDLVGVKRLPWWSRFLIAIVIDFVDFWAALLMAFVPGMHLFFDAWLLVASTMLWGSSGLLQVIEVVPGLHTFFDFLPMVTLSGIVDYWREGGGRDTSTRTDGLESPVAKGVFMGFLAGFLAGFFGKVAGILSVMDIATATIAVGSLVAIFSFFGRDREWRWYAGAAALFGILFVFFGHGAYQESGKLPEKFRETAWQELVKEDDLRVKAAKKADDAREVLGAEGIVEGTKEAVRGAYGASKGFLRERYKGSGEGLVGKWLKEKPATPPAVSGAPAPTLVQKKKQEEEEIPIPADLELGPMEAKVYRSDYVLERAKEQKEKSVEDMREWAFLFFLPALASLVLLALGLTPQDSGSGRTRTITASSGGGHGAVFRRGGGNGTI